MFEAMKTECQFGTEDMTQVRVALPASRSLHAAPFIGLRCTLPSDVHTISPFVGQLMRFISRFRVEDEDNFEIELALREALVNAVVHRNQADTRKHVYVRCRCSTDGEVSITVEDEGNGFEHDAVSNSTTPDDQTRTHGREIYLIRRLMDEIDFEQGGSVLHMRKRASGGSGITRKPQ
jgi:serine/threonine-protein kinase RsbW